MEGTVQGITVKGNASGDVRYEFMELATPHLRTMYAVALRMTANEKAAEDLVQDALLRAFRFFDQFEKGTNLKAWLIKIMTNIFLNGLKKSGRRPPLVAIESMDELVSEADDHGTGISSSEPAFRECLSDTVARALDELPVEYRVPVLLCGVDGLSYVEIAEAMQCPVGTVMSRLYRGRRILERRLAGYAREMGFIDRRART